MEVLEWIAKYWVEWLCTLVTGGVVFIARRYMKMQKQIQEAALKEKDSELCHSIITKLEEEISGVEVMSKEGDEVLHQELDHIHNEIDNVSSGILSLQGKQFRDQCEFLLQPDHIISVEEYEEFEDDYLTYKHLGGNHRGDVLHDRVVDKMKAQLAAQASI